MPKINFEFSLPDERADFLAAVNGAEALAILWDIDQRCRGLLKYGEPTPEQARFAEEIRQMIPAHLLEEV